MTLEEFNTEWDRCSEWIQAALDEGNVVHSLDEIKGFVLANRMQFWPAKDSAVVTQIISGEVGRELNIYLAGGRLDTLQDMMPTLEWFGRKMGCNVCSILGRRGWERSFLTKVMGYKPVATMFGKELYGENDFADQH